MDKYDKCVKYLIENPYLIKRTWENPFHHTGGELFKFVSPNGHTCLSSKNQVVGCLTSIKLGTHVACTDELTQMIRSDDRIPGNVEDITPQNLPVFAEWQRKIDEILGRD